MNRTMSAGSTSTARRKPIRGWISPKQSDVKIKALQQHVSQVPVDEVGKWMTEWAEEEAKDRGMKYAESYKVMILKKDEGEK